ncbi:60S ribosomal protein L17 [Culex quinquefasciatus]|uniref:60S ribosomal protein L17 n=1 Tax=Culex quinquefasciatus TaxID=7176 RepID=B0WW98_CULQU|nr:60S ribosomal protein L17 [Culex quinquefasciatus]|eukprot:XP_001861670.1 60S ribosomal protein L17 [Culex quinquefasciatus]
MGQCVTEIIACLPFKGNLLTDICICLLEIKKPPRSGSAVGKSCGSRGSYLGENYKKIRETALAIKKMPSSQEGGSTDTGGKAGSEDCADSASIGRLGLFVVMDDRSGLLSSPCHNKPSFTKKKDVVTKITESEPEMKKLYIMEG